MTVTDRVRQDRPMPRASMPSWNPEHLRQIRRERGLTMEALASRADMEYGQLKHYIHGRATPSPRALVQIARALDVATTELAPLSERPDLTEYRWHAGLQVDELARRVDLSPAYVGQIARGAGSITHPDLWAAALGISVDQVRAAWQESRRRLREDTEDNEDSGNTESNTDEDGGR